MRRRIRMNNKQIIILTILVIYMAANMIIGLWMSRSEAKGNKKHGFLVNYFAGGRTMGGLVLAMTLIATYTSASSFLGGPGLASAWGLTQSWIAVIQIGTSFLTLGILGKKFGIISRRINAVTVSDYLKARYKSPAVVIICSIALVVFFITQMVAQFVGGATLIQTVTGLPYWAGLLLFAGIVILYTSFGGFTAVVITDTIQGLIMTLGTFLMIFFVFRAGGGMSHMIDQLNSMNPGWDLLGKGPYGAGVTALSPGYMISFWVLVGIAVLGLPQTAVRGMGFKDTKSMHRAMLYGTIVVGILMIGMHFAGAFTLPLLPKGGLESTDAVIPYIVMHVMPSWAAGLFLAAPLAAVMSTVDSLLILASATIIKDLYLSYFAKDPTKAAEAAEETAEEKGAAVETADTKKFDRKIKSTSLLLTLILGIIVAVLALNPPSILVWINLFAMGGLESTFFWPMIGGLYWKYGNSKGSIASIIVGVSTFIFFNQVKIAPFHIHEIVLALITSGIAYFAVSAATKKEPDPDVLRNCF
jgi:sodium/pantothenate symporter